MTRLWSDVESARRLSETMKAVAHPVRLRIVAALCEGQEVVGELAGLLGLPQAVVSQQLRILRMSGLVAVRRENGFACYRLAQPRLRDLVKCLEGCSSGVLVPAGAGRGARRWPAREEDGDER